MFSSGRILGYLLILRILLIWQTEHGCRKRIRHRFPTLHCCPIPVLCRLVQGLLVEMISRGIHDVPKKLFFDVPKPRRPRRSPPIVFTWTHIPVSLQEKQLSIEVPCTRFWHVQWVKLTSGRLIGGLSRNLAIHSPIMIWGGGETNRSFEGRISCNFLLTS